MKILVVDNYDSFVYTIVNYLQGLGATTTVVRNDAVEVSQADNYDGVLISPGPGEPADAGVTMEMIRYCAEKNIPLLGVCLGHQALGECFGGTVSPAPELMHGKTSVIQHDSQGLFAGLPTPLEVTRYHSLAIEPETLSDELNVTASVRTVDGRNNVIMGIQHVEKPLYGVQFHPEAYLTKGGRDMLANWLSVVRDHHRDGTL